MPSEREESLDIRHSEVIGQKQRATAYLDSIWLPDSKLLHVHNFSCVAVQPKSAVCTVRMLCSELCQGPDHIGSAILCQSARDDLQSCSNCSVRVLFYALHLKQCKQVKARQSGWSTVHQKVAPHSDYLLPSILHEQQQSARAADAAQRQTVLCTLCSNCLHCFSCTWQRQQSLPKLNQCCLSDLQDSLRCPAIPMYVSASRQISVAQNQWSIFCKRTQLGKTLLFILL